MEVNKEYEREREKEVREFHEKKGGIKGLVDCGISNLPRLFIHPMLHNLPTLSSSSISSSNNNVNNNGSAAGLLLQVPVIDLQGFDLDSYKFPSRRSQVINHLRFASQTWGCFQILNHGIPDTVMNHMLAGGRRFHDQPREVKAELYSCDPNQLVRFYSNGFLHLNGLPADWRDTLSLFFLDAQLDPLLFPHVCREAVIEYVKHVIELKKKLSELLSESLGLSRDYIQDLKCMETISLLCHYYPPCPEPELTLSASKHYDPGFMTIVLKDNIGGLQVKYRDCWVDVKPLQGALIVNLGDLMQLITNGRYKSREHRVAAGEVGVSVPCFFYPSKENMSTKYGPIKELLMNGNRQVAALYRGTSYTEYMSHFMSKREDGISALSHFETGTMT